jgi:uncharacterized protein
MKILIEIEGKGESIAELDQRNPITARKIYENLPFKGNLNIWQEEIYLDIPLKLDYENPSPSSEKGDISYWPPGSAFCVFYGVSQPYSEVNNIGKIIKNLEIFLDVASCDVIKIEKYEQ